MTEQERRDYAWALATFERGGEVPGAVVEAATRDMDRPDVALLFGQDLRELDRWEWDADREVWIVPPRAEPLEEAAPERAGVSEPPARSSGGGGGDSGGVDLADFEDDELERMIEEAEARERWRNDPEQRRIRWDRRARYLGSVLEHR